MFELAPFISYGRADGQIVILDLGRDRYQRVGVSAARALTALERGGEIAPDEQAGLDILLDAGIVRPGNTGRIAAASLVLSEQSALEHSRSRASLSVGTAALVAWTAIHVAFSLQSSDLAASLDRTRRLRARRQVTPAPDVACAVARDYARYRPLIPLSRSCLPYAIGLSRLLSQRRIAHDLALGVNLTPFRAHAWVQTPSHILSDFADPIHDLTPVFVL